MPGLKQNRCSSTEDGGTWGSLNELLKTREFAPKPQEWIHCLDTAFGSFFLHLPAGYHKAANRYPCRYSFCIRSGTCRLCATYSCKSFSGIFDRPAPPEFTLESLLYYAPPPPPPSLEVVEDDDIKSACSSSRCVGGTGIQCARGGTAAK